MKKRVLFVSVLTTLALSACTIEIPLFPLPESTQESGNSQTTESGNGSTTSQGGTTSTTSQGGTSQGGSTSQGGGTSQGGTSQGGNESQGGGTSQGGTSQGGTSQSSEQQKIQKTHLKQTYTEYATANMYGCDYCPKTGNPKLLIVPVWFTNSSSYITTTSQKNTVRSNIQKAYLGTKVETGWHSVKTYYEDESNGALSLTGVVTDWWSCGYSSSAVDEETTEQLVDAAVDWYFESHASERTSFDTDHNGYLDGVMLIYGAPNSQNGSSNSNLWAYCYWTSNYASVSAPTSNVFFWASYDFMDEDSSITIDAHTYIHEMGHVLGLDDYYDYSGQYVPAGGFSMQDYNVGGHDAFSVMAYGWADPYIPTTSQTIEIGAFQTTKDCILLTPEWNAQDSVFDEYLLLELYTPTGLNLLDSTQQYRGNYPQGPSETGIRLWHVDARLAMRTNTGNQTPTYHSSVTTDLNDSRAKGGVCTAMSNTYYLEDDDSVAYLSPLGSNYYDFNLLQLIRKKTSMTYKPSSENASSYLNNSDLFTNGSTFNMSTYGNQFKKTGKLNSNTNLGWSFSVTINGSGADATASVTVTKA